MNSDDSGCHFTTFSSTFKVKLQISLLKEKATSGQVLNKKSDLEIKFWEIKSKMNMNVKTCNSQSLIT